MSGQEVAETTTTTALPHLQSVARISKLPIVESALGVASGIYGKVKESNRVVGWTLSHAEGVGVAALVPVACRLEVPIHAVDNILDKGIDIVEDKMPAIKMTPQEILDNTRHLVASGLGLNSSGPDASVTARIIGAGVGVATTGLRSAVSVVEWYMDKNFPVEQEEAEKQEEKKEGGGEPAASQDPFQVLLRWQKVSRRLQRVVANSVKRQREDIAGFLGRMAEHIMVVPHPKVLDKVASTYAEISKILQDKGASTTDMAAKVTHQMTSLAVGILGDVGSGIVSLPGGVVATLDGVQKYGMDIVKSVLQRPVKTDAKEEPVNGCDSDERAKLLIARQDQGTSPQPEEPQADSRKAQTTAENNSAPQPSASDEKVAAS